MFRLQLTEQEIAVRNQMVNQFFMVLSIIGVLLLIVSLYRANQIGWQPIMTVHVLSVISLVTITFFKKRLPYLFKAWFAVLLLLFIGLNGFLALGLLTGGHAFILVALTATVSLIGPQAALILGIVTLALLGFIANFHLGDGHVMSVDDSYSHSGTAWSLVIAATLGMTLLIGIMVHRLSNLTRRFMMDALDKANSLALSEARTQAFVQSALSQALVAIDNEGKILRWNAGAEAMFGYSSDEVIGQSLYALIMPPQLPDFPNSSLASSHHALANYGSGTSIPFIAKNRAGESLNIELSLGEWREGDKTFHSVVINDVSETKSYEQKLVKLANTDALTTLPNKMSMIDSVGNRLSQNQQLSLVIVHFNGLSTTNSSLGYLAGDELILETVKRLTPLLKSDEVLARITACQFLLLVDGQSDDRVWQLKVAIERKFNAAIELEGNQIYLTPKFGIVFSNQQDRDAEALLNKAFVALSEAKSSDQQNWAYFNPEYNQQAQKQIALIAGMHEALGKHQFELFYQPQVDAVTGQCKGIEALIRWHHPEEGLLGPNRFIPLAEATDFIVLLGGWVIDQGCKAAKQLVDEGFDDFSMAINISPKQLQLEDIAQRIESTLSKHHLKGHFLEVEVTESMRVSNVIGINEQFAKLHDLGVKLSMDDFGTGYSSFAFLKSISFDLLKFDKSFIDDLAVSESTRRVVKGIVDMSKALGLKVIAEGVETKEQAEVVRDLGCHLIQGYYCAKPMPFDKLLVWMRENQN